MTDPRKAEIPDRLKTLQALSAENADKVAQQTLGLSVVLEAMAAAAAKGHATVLVPPPSFIDLRSTPTWKDTKERLQKMGFYVDEKEIAPPLGPLPVVCSCWGMVVSWVGR